MADVEEPGRQVCVVEEVCLRAAGLRLFGTLDRGHSVEVDHEVDLEEGSGLSGGHRGGLEVVVSGIDRVLDSVRRCRWQRFGKYEPYLGL